MARPQWHIPHGEPGHIPHGEPGPGIPQGGRARQHPRYTWPRLILAGSPPPVACLRSLAGTPSHGTCVAGLSVLAAFCQCSRSPHWPHPAGAAGRPKLPGGPASSLCGRVAGRSDSACACVSTCAAAGDPRRFRDGSRPPESEGMLEPVAISFQT